MAVRKYATQVEETLTKFRQARKLIINDPKYQNMANKSEAADLMQERLKELDAKQTKFLQSIQLAKARALAGL